MSLMHHNKIYNTHVSLFKTHHCSCCLNNGAFHKIKYVGGATPSMQQAALPVFLNSIWEA